MSKYSNDLIMDAALDYIIANAHTICVCSSQPTSYAEAITTYDGSAGKYKLVIHTLTGGDFTKGDGVVSGRKVAVAAQASLSVDATAFANFIALCNSGGSVLLYVTTCTTESLTLGDIYTIPAWNIEIRDPV